MAALTDKEGEIILYLFKNYSRDYNANSLSKEIKITSRGALKIMKKLGEKELVIGKKMGKAVFYKINLKNNYAVKIIETLLIGEAREKAFRWIHEFEELYKNVNITIIFGSAIKNLKEAKDIDVLFVFDKKSYDKVSKFVEQKNRVLAKPIHAIMQTVNDLEISLKKENPAIVSAIRSGYVLYGYDKLVEVIKQELFF